jgi:hypothetical protein
MYIANISDSIPALHDVRFVFGYRMEETSRLQPRI